MRGKKSGAIGIFVGMLLIVIFAVGLACTKNPSIFQRKYSYDYALEQFCSFCASCWLPAGIIGFPVFLIFLITSLIRESREKDHQ